MAKRPPIKSSQKLFANQRRQRMSLGEALSCANQRAHEQANRPAGRRRMKSIHAAIAADEDYQNSIEIAGWSQRILRWLLGLLLVPPSLVTSLTLLERFSHATINQGFWQTAAFWYFATGSLLMIGWFWSGLLKSFFLYLYVLGHELTHVAFVLLCRGKVSDFHVSTQGGYITTNKTNLLIALSPYFVPFWSLIGAIIYAVVQWLMVLHPYWNLGFYAFMGITWTFHMVWTLWMIPRDQPDLKENGTFLSLVIIYLANVLVLATLLCAADDQPLTHAQEFAREWVKMAATCGDTAVRAAIELWESLRTWSKL